MTAALAPVLMVHLAATWFMTGLIWFVQVVHYPLMGRVGADAWVSYERAHQIRTTWVVGPMMTIEAVTAVILVPPVARIATLALSDGWCEDALRPALPEWAAWLGAGLVALLWISTMVVQVPLHARLERGFDAAVHRRLVASNWIRTLLWSARAALLSVVVAS